MAGRRAATAFIRCLPAVMLLALALLPAVIHADVEAGPGSGRASCDGVSVAVNASFFPVIHLAEDGDPAYINLTGENGIFDITNGSISHDFRVNISGSFWTAYQDKNVTIKVYPNASGGGVLEFIPTSVLSATGVTPLSLYALNPTNQSDFAYIDLSVSVNHHNDPPAILDYHDQTVTQGFLSKMQLNGSDEETDYRDFVFTITNLTGGSPPDCISTYTAPDSKQYLCINATNDDVITRHIGLNITLFDGDGGISWEVIDVLVLNSNDPPELPTTWPVETISEYDCLDFYGDYYFEIGPIDDPDLDVADSGEALSYEAYFCGDGVACDLFWDPGVGYSCSDSRYGVLAVEEVADEVNDTISARVRVTIMDHHVVYSTNPQVFLVVYDAEGAEANITIDINIAKVNDMVVIMPAEDVDLTRVNDFNVSQDETLVLGYYGMDMDVESELVWAFEITEMPYARSYSTSDKYMNT